MNIFEYLNLRSEFEELTLNLKVPGINKPGTLRNMRWFLAEGVERNKRKHDMPRAKEIAIEVITKMK